ncbi:MAG: hemolysin III family protein [Candidatus Nanopelagicales bacterium]
MTPVLRGWLHLVAAPLAGLATILLVVLAPSGLRIPLVLFALTTILLFSVSAIYHVGSFSPRVTSILQRWDHANIFLVIAGSATPFAVALLGPGPARSLLAVLWLGAVGGALVRLAWIRAPRWLFVPMYLALGWASAMFLPGFLSSQTLSDTRQLWVLGLIVFGGVLYTLGAGVFATKWPNPSPRWFGFHEVFHSFTLGGWASHFAAAALVVTAVR